MQGKFTKNDLLLHCLLHTLGKFLDFSISVNLPVSNDLKNFFLEL